MSSEDDSSNDEEEPSDDNEDPQGDNEDDSQNDDEDLDEERDSNEDKSDSLDDTDFESLDDWKCEGEEEFEEYTLTDEELAAIQSNLEAVERQSAQQLREEQKRMSAPRYDDIIDTYLSNCPRCENHVIQPDPGIIDLYEQYIQKHETDIAYLSRFLRELFMRDRERRVHGITGRLNLMRYSAPRLTPQIFDRRKLPEGKSDVSVMIVVDQSGSMSGSKIEAAMQTTITLAEAFSKVGIPIYVMGFSTGSGICHDHYVCWGNSEEDRATLLRMSAGGCNCDGYSLRYATRLLQERHEKKRLMVMIHDGLPSEGYKTMAHGIADCREAVSSAKAYGIIPVGVGVAIGNEEKKKMEQIYRSDFFLLNDPKKMVDLFIELMADLIR